jgi:hypothetical protein
MEAPLPFAPSHRKTATPEHRDCPVLPPTLALRPAAGAGFLSNRKQPPFLYFFGLACGLKRFKALAKAKVKPGPLGSGSPAARGSPVLRSPCPPLLRQIKLTVEQFLVFQGGGDGHGYNTWTCILD